RPLSPTSCPGRFEGEHARGIELRLHIRKHPLNGLIVGDRLAERLALLRVRQRFVERRFTDAERLSCDGDPSAMQRPSRQIESLVDGAEHLRLAARDVELELLTTEP